MRVRTAVVLFVVLGTIIYLSPWTYISWEMALTGIVCGTIGYLLGFITGGLLEKKMKEDGILDEDGTLIYDN